MNKLLYVINERRKVHWKRQALFCLKEIQNPTPSDFRSMSEWLFPSITYPLRAQMQCATPEQILNLAVRATMPRMGSTVHHSGAWLARSWNDGLVSLWWGLGCQVLRIKWESEMKAGLNCCLETPVRRENHREVRELPMYFLWRICYGTYTDPRSYWKRTEGTSYVLNTYYVLDAFVYYPLYFSEWLCTDNTTLRILKIVTRSQQFSKLSYLVFKTTLCDAITPHLISKNSEC